jgi:ActR/RegA family two-component response regulator
MTRLLIVDDSTPVADRDQLPKTISEALGWDVATARRPDDLPALLDRDAAFDVAMVDLSYANSTLNGLDALLTLHERVPACRLVVYTQGDAPFADMLRDAWDAFDLGSALSKLSDLDPMLRTLQQVARDGSAPVDPVLLPLLPAQRSPWRSLDGYCRLVGHAGHAKLWRALIELGEEPSYRDLAAHTGLSIQSVRNYRSELLGDLALHYLDAPRMREMQRFAKRCRPLLAPHIRAKLGDGSV